MKDQIAEIVKDRSSAIKLDPVQPRRAVAHIEGGVGIEALPGKRALPLRGLPSALFKDAVVLVDEDDIGLAGAAGAGSPPHPSRPSPHV
jgi:hypothetical protein